MLEGLKILGAVRPQAYQLDSVAAPSNPVRFPYPQEIPSEALTNLILR
jgi:hypothetical protein